MILLKLVNKELVQFFRNKTDVITMFVFPIVLIVVMGISLNGLMNTKKDIFVDSAIYYNTNNLDKEDEYLKAFYLFKDNFEEITKSKFIEIDNTQVGKDSVEDGSALTVIDINKNSYSIYRGAKKDSSESQIFRSVFKQYLNKYALKNVVENELRISEQTLKSKEVLNEILNKESSIIVSKEGINNSGINSYTYYTFAELVLIILYISSITSVSMYKEYYLNTMSRFKVSKVSIVNIILSKLILGVVIGILQILVVYFVSTRFLDVNWGVNIIGIVVVLLGIIIFSSTLGIFLSMIFKDPKSASTVSNMIIIIMGLLGGSYMPISLIKSISITNILCSFVPTYWANISLLSLSSNIHTYYPQISLFICTILSIMMITVGVIYNKLRVGKKWLK